MIFFDSPSFLGGIAFVVLISEVFFLHFTSLAFHDQKCSF